MFNQCIGLYCALYSVILSKSHSYCSFFLKTKQSMPFGRLVLTITSKGLVKKLLTLISLQFGRLIVQNEIFKSSLCVCTSHCLLYC